MMDDLREKIEALGIPVGTWGESIPKGGTNLPPTIQRQREKLLQIRGILTLQIEEDRKKKAQIHESLARLKHGGGQ